MDISPEEYAAIIATDQLAFTEEVFSQVSPAHQYLSNWHIECIIEHLKAVEAGEIQRLNINMPPRMMKSITVSEAWSAWLLGQNPSTQIIAASFKRDVGVDIAEKVRKVMKSPIYQMAFPNTAVAKDTEDWFTTTQGGHRLLATTGKGVTGFGADVILIDDPINPEEATSETSRLKAFRWITGTLFPRANDLTKVKIVNVMQRLHEEDPSGKFLEAEGWHNLVLPAYFHKKTFIEIRGKKWEAEEGEYLHKERVGAKELNDLRDSGMSEYQLAGQYMQNPAPIGGGEFKARYLKYYNNHSKDFTCKGMNIYILYDPANSKKNKENSDPDYTAMMVLGLANDNNYYLLDAVRDRMNPTERVNALIKLHMKWNKKAGKPPKVVCEKYGMMTDSFYIDKAQGELNYRFPLVEVGGRMKKEDRIRRLIAPFENERFFLPRTINYTNIEGETVDMVTTLVEKEMMTFPVGKHDDMLDALSRVFDDEVYATFPKVDVHYLKGGESIRDSLLDGYDEDDFMSW
jgi:predicted phage terminase large subunit-like protein